MSKLKKFIQNNPSFTDSESIRCLCQSLEQLGIYYFSHIHINHANEMAGLTNFPEFGRHYLEQGYQHYDIHQLVFKQQQQMVIWDLIELQNTSKKMHDDFQAFGRGHTCTIIQEDAQGRNYFNFASHYGHESVNQVYMQNRNMLDRFICFFRDKISRDKSLKKIYQNRLALAPVIGTFQTSTPIPELSLEDFYKQTNSDRIFVNNQTYLTPSEYKCLYWLSRGKTLDETAMILRLATRTIKAHVQAAKQKLNCNNLFQLGMFFSKLPR